MNSSSLPVTIRPAYPSDGHTLSRLAQLDSSTIPSEPLLVAEVDGELRVAVSMSDGSVIADPFVATAHVVRMLQDHIARTTAPSPHRRFRSGLPLAAALRAA
jgi:hypothetical protein